MKKFNVSLDVIAPGDTKPEFFAIRGIDSPALSRRSLRHETLWRFEPDFDEDASLQEQIESIFALVHPATVTGDGVRAYLSIAVFYDTATCTVEIPAASLSLLHGSGIAIEITCYPSTAEEDANGSPRAH